MDAETRAKILKLLATHRVMRIATLRRDGWPQVTTVGYVSEDLTLYFVCGADSQKANNLADDTRVSLAIDHDTSDILQIEGLSMAARATLVHEPDELARIMELLLQRYPGMAPLPGPVPTPGDVRVFRVEPVVISLLDYSKGFGHSELIAC